MITPPPTAAPPGGGSSPAAPAPGREVLADLLSPRLSRRRAAAGAAMACMIILATLVIAPFGAYPGPQLPPVVLIYAVMASLIEGLTAYFLAVQFKSNGEPFFGGLAGAFGFVSILVVSQMLVFPGVFSVKGLFNGRPQSSIWMWALWHMGFPLFVIMALVLRVLSRRRLAGRGAGLAMLAAGPVAAALLVYMCIAHGPALPILITGGSYVALRHSWVMAVIILAPFLALLACVWVTRLRDLLSLWLAIALLASLSDALLTLSGAVRYDVGWYAGRIQSALSSSTVFCVLILELSQLYGKQVQANEILARRAVRDGLTGAFNRGYFAEQFPREVRRAAREVTAMSLLLTDVDHFKAYNDLYGHQQGDACLIALVEAMQRLMRRPGDIVARYGGEEFAVLLPGTDREGAFKIAHEIRAAVAALRLERSDTATGLVTLSIGIATLDPSLQGAQPAEMLRRADLALYQAKHEGRNTIRFQAEADVVQQAMDSFTTIMSGNG